MSVIERLKQLGIELSPPSPAVGAYVPVRRCGGTLVLSGQLPMRDGKLLCTGKVPSGCSVELAGQAARQCVVNALSHIQAAVGLDAVAGIVRLGVFVQSDASFTGHVPIANAASELLVAAFGEAGRHARTTVGVASLPLDAPVEVELTVELKP